MSVSTVVVFVGGPLDGEQRAIQGLPSSVYTVRRFLRHDARYWLDSDGRTYRFMGEPTERDEAWRDNAAW